MVAIKLRDDGKKRYIYSDIRKEPKEETQRESQSKGKTGLNRKTPEQLAAEKRAEALALAGISEPVIKRKGETTSEAVQRSKIKTESLFTKATKRPISANVSIKPTARTETPTPTTQPSQQERFNNLYSQGYNLSDPSGFVFGKEQNINYKDTNVTYKVSRQPQDFTQEFTVQPNITDRLVFFTGKTIFKDKDYIQGGRYDNLQKVANIRQQTTGEGLGISKDINKIATQAKLGTFNPVQKISIGIASGAFKSIVQNPTELPLTVGAGALAGTAVGVGKTVISPAVSYVKGVRGGAAALKGINIGTSLSLGGVAVGSAALDIGTSKKPLERTGAVATQYAAVGYGFNTGLKSGISQGDFLKVKYAEIKSNVQSELLNQKYAGQLTTNVKPKDVKKFQTFDVTVQGREVKGIQFAGSQTPSGRTTYRKTIYGQPQKIKPQDIQPAEFYELNYEGTKIGVYNKPALTTGTAVEPQFNFIVGEKGNPLTKVTIKGNQLINKKQGDFLINSEGFGRTSNQKGFNTEFLSGKAELQGAKFSREGGLTVLKRKPSKIPTSLRLEQAKPLTEAEYYGFVEKGTALKPEFRPPVFYEPAKPVKVVKNFKVYRITDVLSKPKDVSPTQSFSEVGKVSGSAGTTTITVLKGETVKNVKPDVKTETLTKSQKVSVQSVRPTSLTKSFTLQKRLYKVSETKGVETKNNVASFKGVLSGFSRSTSKSDVKSSSGFNRLQGRPQAFDAAVKTKTAITTIPDVLTSTKPVYNTVQKSFFSNTFKDFTLEPKTTRPFKPKRPGYIPKFDNDEGGLFDVQVRRRGEFRSVTSKGVSFKRGLKIGSNIVGSTAAASFRVVPRSGGGRLDTGVALNNLGSRYRLSKKDKDVFVQKSQFRISTLGEKLDITAKGIASKKKKKRFGGFF